MKTVLIVAYDFPPRSTSGVYRPLKFARYLPDFGWRPVILTVSNYPHDVIDETLMGELPESAVVYRAHSIEPKRWEKSLFKSLYKRPGDPRTQSSSSPASGGGAGNHGFSLKASVKKLLFSPLSHFSHNYLYTPDEHIGWLPLGVMKGLRAISHEHVDVILSTSPPETNHIVGLWLNRLTGKPWIADFRDPWTDNFMKQSKPKLRVQFERSSELKVLKNSNLILHVGERMAQLSRQSFPEIDPLKHRWITNGYDEHDYAGIDADAVYRKHQAPELTVLNVGTVYEDSAMLPLVRAFGKVVSRPEYRGKLKLTFIGRLMEMHKAALAAETIKDHTTLTGFIPHHEALETMMSSDVILLMPAKGDVRTNDKIIPGKLFELLRSGRPILMLGWEGESANIVRKSGTGLFVPAEDEVEIEKALTELYRRKQAGLLAAEPDWNYIRQFDRKELTRRLSGLLNQVANGTSSASDQSPKGHKVAVR